MRQARASRTIGALALRRTWRGAVALGAANALVVGTAVIGYVAAYPEPADRITLARSIGANPGLTALFGETRALETVAGFTEWRVVLVLALVGAVWALLATTRVLRGEEESGRADLLLAGPISPVGATLATLTGLAGSIAVLLVVSVVGCIPFAGGDLGADRIALLALAVVGTTAVMVGVAAVASQLAATRRRAVSTAAGLLGAMYLVRVLASSVESLGWLHWVTPLGWLQQAHPLTGPRLLPIALSYALAAALVGVAVLLVRIRDTGDGLVASSGSRQPRLAGLSGPFGLAARLAAGPAVSWAIGLAVFGALIGLVARTAAEAMADASGGDVLDGLGLGEAGTLAYVGASFLFVSVALATAAAALVAATREEEASGRLDALVTRPVARGPWLASRLLSSLGVLVIGSIAATTAAWAAGLLGDLGVPGPELVAAGANALPAAVFVLGAGTSLHGLVPRLATPLVYGLVAGSFLLEVVGSAVGLPGWLLGASVLHHVAPAPAVRPDWGSAAVIVAIGVLLAGVGALALHRRDLATP